MQMVPVHRGVNEFHMIDMYLIPTPPQNSVEEIISNVTLFYYPVCVDQFYIYY